jgi:uncharacterized protein with gpF-like domain
LIEGGRSSEISGLIMATGHVTKSRANNIARTEVSRASSMFTEIRAKSIGSNGYIWRDSGDGDVRHDHHLLNGQFIPWDSPLLLTESAELVPMQVVFITVGAIQNL